MSATTKRRAAGVLAFMGFKPRQTDAERQAAATALDEAARAEATGDDAESDGKGKGAKAAVDEDEEEEDEEEEGDEDNRKAVRQRNALRAAGHRRGAAAERARVASIMNGVDPAQAELALSLALNSDMSAEQVSKTLKAAPAAAAGRTPFAATMDRITAALPAPGFGAGASSAKPPRMAEVIAARFKLPAPK